MESPGTRRDTRPLRPVVRTQLERLLAISPDGRTMSELQSFLITQRPASRDTIARVLSDLVAEGLVGLTPEPRWRRLARGRTAGNERPSLRGRTHQLYTPTRALHDRVACWFTLSPQPES